MVAHNITNPPHLRPLDRALFEENSSVRFFVMWFRVAPIDEIQVEPCLMMATLIGWPQAESFAWDGERTVHAYLPIPIRAGRNAKKLSVHVVSLPSENSEYFSMNASSFSEPLKL